MANPLTNAIKEWWSNAAEDVLYSLSKFNTETIVGWVQWGLVKNARPIPNRITRGGAAVGYCVGLLVDIAAACYCGSAVLSALSALATLAFSTTIGAAIAIPALILAAPYAIRTTCFILQLPLILAAGMVGLGARFVISPPVEGAYNLFTWRRDHGREVSVHIKTNIDKPKAPAPRRRLQADGSTKIVSLSAERRRLLGTRFTDLRL